MLKRVFACFMMLATLVIILVLCLAISPKGEETFKADDVELALEGDIKGRIQNKVSPSPTCSTQIVKEEKIAYLTFDDGPSKNTRKILDILDKYNVKATFFVVGSLVNKEYGSLLKSMYDEGHSIGIHTFSHDYNQIYLSKEEYLKDFNKAKESIEKYVGNPIKIYRFPGGSCNCFIGKDKDDIIKELEAKNYNYYDWNVSGEDSLNNPSLDSIIRNVVKDYKNLNRPIILLHDGVKNNNTVYSLSTIIENLKRDGYSFGTLN